MFARVLGLSTKRRLLAATGGMAAVTLASRISGLVRDKVVAYLLGAGLVADAFYTAFRIPNLLRDLFAEGALSAAFVTTFTQKLTSEGEKSAWRLANLVLNALLIVLGLITVAGVIVGMSPWCGAGLGAALE